jgi:phosphomannomutase
MRAPIIKFGTEGWRGIIADDFTVANVRLATHAIANHLKEAAPPGEGVLVAYDCRAQSEIFAEAAARILIHHDFQVWVAPRPVSSPAAVYGMLDHKMQGAIMFTASHNPAPFHGIKFKPHYGGAALTAITDSIEQHLHALLADFEKWIEPVEEGMPAKTLDPVPAYLGNLQQFIQWEAIQDSHFRVATDSMHGSGAGYIGSVLSRLGLEVIALREERNPWFGGSNPEPMEANLHDLMQAVRNQGAHAGIAIDGDGDRVGAVDEQGNFVDSHRIFAITLKHLIEHRGWKGEVVKTVSVSRMIDRLCKHFDMPLHVTPIGFKFICERMLEKDVLMGGEESGGIGIKRYMLERDGVLMGLLLLEAMAVNGKSLSELVHDVFDITGSYHYRRIDAHFEREQMPLLRDRLQTLHLEQVGEELVELVDATDGIKHVLQNGTWLLMRASGTEPVIRIYAEASSPEAARRLAEEGERILHRLIET